MPSIFTNIKENKQNRKSIFQQETTGKSIFSGEVPSKKVEQPIGYSQEDLSRKILPQLTTGIAEQVPYGRKVDLPVPIEQMPSPQGIPAKVARSAGNLLGMMPSFLVGGGPGGAVGKGVTGQLVKQMPRLAKYIGAMAGGATTFTGAKALRNIGQNEPIQAGLPEEAVMGAVFGPTGVIRNKAGAIVVSTALGAGLAPKGEKLSQGILFGGLTALTHQRPDLSAQDRTNINTLYQEATFKEGIREVQRGITQRQLPAPTTLYGEGFTSNPAVSKIPVSIQKQLGFRQPQQLEYQPNLEKGAIRQGEGFTVVGGKQIARPLAKGVAKELRTTPTPEGIIAKVEPQVQKDIQEARARKIISGVVVTPKDLEPISNLERATREFESRSKELDIKLAKRKLLSTPTEGKVDIWSGKTGIPHYDAHFDKTIVGEGLTRKEYYKKYKDMSGEVIQMPPSEYMELAAKGQWEANIERNTKDWGSYKKFKEFVFGERMSQEKLGRLKEKLSKGEKLDIPSLEYDSKTGTLNNQEGYHRAKLVQEMGIKEIPVMVVNNPKLSTPTGEGQKPTNKRGSIAVPPEFTEPIAEIATKIYRGAAPAGEVLRNDKLVESLMAERQRKISEVNSGELPRGMLARRYKEINDSEKVIQYVNQSGGKDESILVTRVADAIDKERAFANKYTQILDLADKVGITEGSKASEIIFKALDYRRALPEEISKLTPDQQKFIPIIRNAYKEIWRATGKPEYEGIRDYATHLIRTGKEMGYDVSHLGRFLPDELYSRFFESRKGAKPYSQDIVKALDTYIPNVARKIFREPVLQEYNNLLDSHLSVDYKNEAVDFMEAFLGRGRYRSQEALGRLPKDLVRLTYRGTLYGNFSAATKNATQILTNTIPEIGLKSTTYGYRKLMTPEGRQDFVNSGLAGDFSLGKPIDQLDFFSQVEFVNRGVTYLGAKQKALSEGKGLIEAENYAKKIVRKTQFIQTGIDAPKLYRQYGTVGRMVGQFTQFPTKQGFLIWNWARQGHWDKVARFATIAYLLGGTRTVPFLNGIIDGDYKQLPQMPDDIKKLIRNVEKYTSLAGLSGMDIGQNFGFGIYSGGVPLGRGPALGLFKEIGSFVKAVGTREITTLPDIIRSRLVQKSLPTLIPGGTSVKKIIDLINADENDYKIRNAYNQLQYTSSPKEEILRIFVGPTKERKEAWESLSKERQDREIYANDHRKMLDYLLDSKGDYMALEEFMKKYPKYNISNITDELMERAKKRELPVNVREYLTRPKALR